MVLLFERSLFTQSYLELTNKAIAPDKVYGYILKILVLITALCLVELRFIPYYSDSWDILKNSDFVDKVLGIISYDPSPENICHKLVATTSVWKLSHFFLPSNFLRHADDVVFQVCVNSGNILYQSTMKKIEFFLGPLNQEYGLLTWTSHPEVIAFLETPKHRYLIVIIYFVLNCVGDPFQT